MDLAMQQIRIQGSAKQFALRTNQGAAQTVEHSPRSLITSQAQHVLQAQGVGAVLPAHDLPDHSKPDAQFATRLVRKRPVCGRRLLPTRRDR